MCLYIALFNVLLCRAGHKAETALIYIETNFYSRYDTGGFMAGAQRALAWNCARTICLNPLTPPPPQQKPRQIFRMWVLPRSTKASAAQGLKDDLQILIHQTEREHHEFSVFLLILKQETNWTTKGKWMLVPWFVWFLLRQINSFTVKEVSL